jgi:KDO2-lipid IV(A) lauroyltransferase
MRILIYLISLPFIYFIAILPFQLLYAFSDFLSFILYYLVGYRKKVVRENLIRSGFGDDPVKLRKIERAVFKHFCDLYLETFKSLTLSKKQIQKRFVVTDSSLMQDLASKGKSVIMMCGHYASYEWLLSLGYYSDHTAYGIYAPLSNPYFNKLVIRARKRYGAFLIPRRKAISTIKDHVNNKHLALYGFASDQSPRVRKKTYFRSFFGTEVPVFTGAERLGKEHDIPVLMAKVRKLKRGYYEAEIVPIALEPTKTKENFITDTFTEALEVLIQEDPRYYLWTHNRFKRMRPNPLS